MEDIAMRMPEGEERTGDENVEVPGVSSRSSRDAAHHGAGGRNTRRDDFTGNA